MWQTIKSWSPWPLSPEHHNIKHLLSSRSEQDLSPMQCDACRREAVVFQPYSGKHLCPVHFLKDFEAKAKRTIRSHGWLRPGDHIAVVLPGDAAGAALLVFLVNLTENRRDIRLSAITIDHGMSGCSAPGTGPERGGCLRRRIVLRFVCGALRHDDGYDRAAGRAGGSLPLLPGAHKRSARGDCRSARCHPVRRCHDR